MSREADRQELPALMRRDVRLLGELVAKAFTTYFHLTNQTGERQRVRTLRGPAAGEEPRQESLAAAVAQLGAEPGGHRLDDLLG